MTTRIIDRGYRHYLGPRRGVVGSMRSVVRHTTERCLGLHRPARAKVFPVLVVVLAYVPTLVYVGVAVIGNRLEREGAPGRALAASFIPRYADNYGQVVLAVILFAAFVAPEVLCPDRRSGMLGLYLASPLDRITYLVSKAASVLMLVSLVTVGPGLILLIGYATQGYGPVGARDWATTVGRIIGAGLAISVLYTMVALAISSVTSRKAAASASFVALMIGVPGLITYLIIWAGASSSLGLLNLLTLPYEAVYRIFEEPTPFVYGGEPALSAGAVWAAYAGWVALSLLVIADRYRRVQVTR